MSAEKQFFSIEDWFSYKACSTSGSNVTHAAKHTFAMLGMSQMREPLTLRFKECTLKRDLLHFKAGTFFDELAFNENQVLYFYIRDDKKQHFMDRPGYNYLGHWDVCFEVDEKKVPATQIWQHFKRENTKIGDGRFDLVDCKSVNQFGQLKENEKFARLSLDFVNSAFTVVTKGKGAFGGKLSFALNFKERDIPLAFLDQAVGMGMIDERDRDEQKRRGYDVDLPPTARNDDEEDSEENKKEKEPKKRKYFLREQK